MDDLEMDENNEWKPKKKGFMSLFDDPDKARALFFASLLFNHGPGGSGGTGPGGIGF